MDHDEVLALFDRRMRREAAPDSPGAVVERVGDVLRQTGGGADTWAGVLWSDLTGSTADAAIAEQVAHAKRLGREFEWKLYGHDGPADLGERLLAAGFEPEPTETLMVAPVAGLPTDARLPEGVELQRVTDAAGVEQVVQVHAEVFGGGADRMRARLLTRLAEDPDTLSMVVAVAEGEPVCAARMELYPGTGFAGLWGGGTLPAWRGKGIYRALVAHRAREAAAAGYEYLQVDASDLSRPILQRLGFAALSTTTPYLLTP
ncbi:MULTISPECIES: GNAT family N-acetyltransferase [Streptacidiphilus]|uniref:GNAT family N-acetyltransferase n=2 Tax=Streptacidiphilus TaxID=228398 RepID=A0ABV6UUT0_9ACTN|nr:GNAT family N-acetyltransferase [Streptacidiphilus jeojiense]